MKLNMITMAFCMHMMSWTDNGYVTTTLKQSGVSLVFMTMQTPSSGQIHICTFTGLLTKRVGDLL